jgi:hypothetical protein
LLARKQGATTGGITGFALEQCAAAAILASGVFGEFGFVHFTGIGFVTQASCIGIGLCHHWHSSKHRT